MMKNKYGLLFKTGGSEIRAIKNLPTTKGILPIVELTRGRKTLKDTVGDVQKSVERLADHIGHSTDVILDLTTEEYLSNKQIEALLEPDNGYKKWVEFLIAINKEKPFKNIFPVLLNSAENFNEENLKKEVSSMLQEFNGVAYRCNIEDEGFSDDIETIAELILSSGKEFFFVVDCGYIRYSEVARCTEQVVHVIRYTHTKIPQAQFILTSTSFPDRIGEAVSDVFPLTEITLYNEVSRRVPNIDIMYGDYGSVHPRRNDNHPLGSGWRPRVDVPLETEIFYCLRKKISEGYAATYSLVAADAVKNEHFPSKISNWGIQQILNAADGAAPGASPSFWISVRMNMHIEQQLKRLSLR
jgi:hypothetical protein